MEIFAHHAHVFPDGSQEGGSISALLSLMDDCDVGKAVCFAPFARQAPEIDRNAWLAETIAPIDRLYGFGTVDFSREDIAEQVDRIAEMGLLGIKVHPAYQAIPVLSDKARAVYSAAERLGLFVTFHTGIHWHRISHYHPLLFDEIAFEYPKLSFSMEHVGGFCFFNDAPAVLENNMFRKNAAIYAGLTSVFDDGQKFWYLSDRQLQDLIWQVGDDTSFFGLDFPWNNARSVRDAIKRIRDLFPEDTACKILGGNLTKALRLA